MTNHLFLKGQVCASMFAACPWKMRKFIYFFEDPFALRESEGQLRGSEYRETTTSVLEISSAWSHTMNASFSERIMLLDYGY